MTTNKQEQQKQPKSGSAEEQAQLLESQRNRGTARAFALTVLNDGVIGDPNQLINGSNAQDIGEKLDFEVIESDNAFPLVKATAWNGDTIYITATQGIVRVVPSAIATAEKEAIANKNQQETKTKKSKSGTTKKKTAGATSKKKSSTKKASKKEGDFIETLSESPPPSFKSEEE